MKKTSLNESKSYLEFLLLNEQTMDTPANVSEPNEIPIMMGFIDVEYEITDNNDLALVLLDADESGDKDQGFIISFTFEKHGKHVVANVDKVIQTSPIQRELSKEQIHVLLDNFAISKIFNKALIDIEDREAEKMADNEPDDYTGEDL